MPKGLNILFYRYLLSLLIAAVVTIVKKKWKQPKYPSADNDVPQSQPSKMTVIQGMLLGLAL